MTRVRRPALMLRLLLAALLLPAATGCGVVGAAVAPTGARPGVDVPGDSGDWADAPLGRPALAPPGTGGYVFTMTRPDGSPVTFDPCRPVPVVVRPDHEPAGADQLLRQALAEVGAATGLQFVVEGRTDEVPSEDRAAYQPERYGDRWAPVLVAWGTPGDTPLLRGDGPAGGGVLGRAGPLAWGSGADARFVTGMAVFNAPAIEAQLRLGDDEKARAVLLHELGHLVGLGHVSDPYQVMYDTNVWPLPTYRAGDLRGLERLGLGPCFDRP